MNKVDVIFRLTDSNGAVAENNLSFDATSEDTLLNIVLRTGFAEMPGMLKALFELDRVKPKPKQEKEVVKISSNTKPPKKTAK